MKLVFAGKGGTGKTTLAGTIARMQARRGFRVLAIDGDASPNLGMTLGLPAERCADSREMPRDGKIAGLGQLSSAELAAPYLTEVEDGLSLLIVARAEVDDAGTGCLTLAHRGMRALVEATASDYDVTILDSEGTSEHLARGTSGFADVMLLIVEPTRASLQSAARMAAMSKRLEVPRIAIVANKIRTGDEWRAVRRFGFGQGIESIWNIPFDEKLQAAERYGIAPTDARSTGRAGALPAIASISAAFEPQRTGSIT